MKKLNYLNSLKNENNYWKIKSFIVIVLIFLICFSGCIDNPDTNDDVDVDLQYDGKKIMVINSYHLGYEWSDGIEKGVLNILNNTGIELKFFRMDTKRNTDEDFIIQKGLEAKNLIDEFKPDVVITSDDNAFKYVIMPYYKNADLPVVFCGVNWDASIYDAPYNNTAGMIEVALVPSLIDHLEYYSNGSRIGYIAANVTTARKEGDYYQKFFDLDILEKYVISSDEWKAEYTTIQQDVDILIVGNNAGINDWDEIDVESFVLNNTIIPTGAIYTWMMPYSLIGLTKVEEEQGEWAAQAALEIIDGKDPIEIGITENSQGRVLVNMAMAEKMDIILRPDLLKIAEIV